MQQSVPDGGVTVKEVVEAAVKSLVDHPKEVRVEEVADGRVLTYNIHVNPADIGKIVGKEGQTIAALRALIARVANRFHRDSAVEVIDRKGGRSGTAAASS